jgi:hypothetical protein
MSKQFTSDTTTTGLGSKSVPITTGTTGLGTTSTAVPPMMPTSTTGTVPGVSSFAKSSVVAPVVEHVDRPPVIHEKYRREQIEEVQPIIHRERDRTEVHQVVQPIYEGQTEAVRVQQRELPAQCMPTRAAPAYIPAPVAMGTKEFAAESHMTIQKPAIVEEIERRKIIEEIQPVIYKEVVQPSIVKETQPVFEKIVEPYTVTKEVRPPIYLQPGTTSVYETGKIGTPLSGTTGMATGLGTTGMTSGLGTTGTAPTLGQKIDETFSGTHHHHHHHPGTRFQQ